MTKISDAIISPLPNRIELEKGAQHLLKRAGVLGALPTRLDVLLDHSKIHFHDDLPEKESFLKTLPEKGRNIFLTAVQKIRGISDLREKVIYIPKDKNTRERFTLAHEIAHTTIEHHNLNKSLIDTNEELSPYVKDLFEKEANYFGAELLFQGDNFLKRARDYFANIDAPLTLANDHETSFHSTIWKFVEVQDEKVCVAEFYPIKKGCLHKGFKLYRAIGSDSFRSKFPNITFPNVLEINHDWTQAIQSNSSINGTQKLICDGNSYNFEWSAWFNTFTLFVMLRHRPALHNIGSTIRRIKEFSPLNSSSEI